MSDDGAAALYGPHQGNPSGPERRLGAVEGCGCEGCAQERERHALVWRTLTRRVGAADGWPIEAEVVDEHVVKINGTCFAVDLLQTMTASPPGTWFRIEERRTNGAVWLSRVQLSDRVAAELERLIAAERRG